MPHNKLQGKNATQALIYNLVERCPEEVRKALEEHDTRHHSTAGSGSKDELKLAAAH